MKLPLRIAALVTTVAMTLAWPASLAAQSLQQQNEEILQELRAIRALLEKLAGPVNQPSAAAPPAAAPAPANDQITLANIAGPMLGKADAPLTIVEFTDLQCPFCRQFHITAFEQLKKDYIDTGKARYISRDFPLTTLHPLAMKAAVAARCALAQGKFWEMRHTILANNPTLAPDSFARFAHDLQLNAAAFNSCVADSTRIEADIQKEMADGRNAHVSATPTFLLGRTTPVGVTGTLIIGAQSYAVFDSKLKELLEVR